VGECKYHVVFIPKCRRRTLYKQLRPYLGEVFSKLASRKDSRIEEGHYAESRRMLIDVLPTTAPPVSRGQ